VSTEEQTLDNQRADIKRVLRSRRLRQVASFEEQVSAAKARPEFDAMMEAAHRGEFDVIVVWALDRFGRSMVGNLQAVLDLDRCGVEVISVNESSSTASTSSASAGSGPRATAAPTAL